MTVFCTDTLPTFFFRYFRGSKRVYQKSFPFIESVPQSVPNLNSANVLRVKIKGHAFIIFAWCLYSDKLLLFYFVKLNYLHNTGTCCLGYCVMERFSTAKRVLIIKTFYENGECIRRSLS